MIEKKHQWYFKTETGNSNDNYEDTTEKIKPHIVKYITCGEYKHRRLLNGILNQWKPCVKRNDK